MVCYQALWQKGSGILRVFMMLDVLAEIYNTLSFANLYLVAKNI